MSPYQGYEWARLLELVAQTPTAHLHVNSDNNYIVKLYYNGNSWYGVNCDDNTAHTAKMWLYHEIEKQYERNRNSLPTGDRMEGV